MADFRQIPLSALKESPFNPRKHYDEAELIELAESVKSQGVMQPIVVRIQPEEVNQHGHFEYEIVFGHRRFRAARLAELEEVPAIVREMTDEQAAIAQVHENMKRKDVTALEEADGYVHLRDAYGMTAERIGKEVGKTKSYVYARLKLAAAAPGVRIAVSTRGMSPEIALLIARLPHFDMQTLAITQVLIPRSYGAAADEPERWASVRETKLKLKQLFENDVDVAQFDITDDGLIESAGACTTCPKRAGNMESLSEILDSGICTDTECFNKKQAAFVWLKTDQLRETGHQVIEGDEAKKLMPYAGWIQGHRKLEETPFGGSHEPTSRELMARPGAPQIVPITIVNPHDGRLMEIITSDQARQLHNFANGVQARPESDEDEVDHEAEHAALIASLSRDRQAVLDASALRDVRKAVLMAMVESARQPEDLRCIVLREMDMAGYYDSFDDNVREISGLAALAEAAKAAATDPDDFDEDEWCRTWVREEATLDQLGLLMAMIGVEHALEGRYGRLAAVTNSVRLVSIANSYGVDPANYLPARDDDDQDAEAAETPSTAAQAQDGDEGHAAEVDGDVAADSPAPAAPAKKPKAPKKAAKVRIARVEAGSAGDDQKDEPADAGVARDPNTSDMFHEEVGQ